MATGTADLDALLDMPALAPPPGVTPNFENPPNENALATAVITTTMAIATICLLLRAYARVYLLRKVQLEEALIMCAYGVYLGQTYCCYALLGTPGYFVHQWNLKMGQLVSTSYNVLLIGTFYQTVLPLLKAAILTEWIRLFAPAANRLRSPFWWGCVFIITLQVVWGVVCVILLNVQCTPHEAIWEIWLPRNCYNLVPVQLTSGSVQLFSDVVMLLLPQRTIWKLKLSWRKRMGVSVVFGMGILACISAAFRLGVTVSYGYDPDQMFQLAPVVFWVMAETTCGFFIVCMPCLPKIFKETGVVRRFKRAVGMPATATGASRGPAGSDMGKYGYSSKHSAGGSALSRSAATADAYHKLDEEVGVALGGVSSDSKERLRSHEDSQLEHLGPAPQRSAAGNIMRTTHVTVQVSSDASSANSDPAAPSSFRPARRGDGRDGWYR